MFNSILVVCIGNICRSPIAEAMLAKRLKDKKLDVVVSSAGIGALVGYPADPISVDLTGAYGIDISAHKARQLVPELVFAADLIITMTASQEIQVVKMFPSTKGRVFRLGNWGGFDIADPYQRPKAIFEQAFSLIEQGVNDWCEKLCPLN